MTETPRRYVDDGEAQAAWWRRWSAFEALWTRGIDPLTTDLLDRLWATFEDRCCNRLFQRRPLP